MASKREENLSCQAGSVSSASEDPIRIQLRRILSSPEFRATQSQRAFLEYIVEKVLRGESEGIKGYTVATEVFGRGEDFDQATDPIVSIHANKLRRALERYYLTAGRNDPTWIDIPKGTYVPVFKIRGPSEPVSVTAKHGAAEPSYGGAFPTVMVRPFQNLVGDPGQNFLAIGLPIEIANELSRYPDLRVMVVQPEKAAADIPSVARFAVEGQVTRDAEQAKVAVQLIDTASGRHLWSASHAFDPDAGLLIAFQERIARSTSVIIGGETGIIPRALSTEFRRHTPAEINTYHAILQYYAYDQTLTVENFQKAFAALQKAVDTEPSCRQIWTMLGRLYANIFSLGIPGFDDPLAKAYEYAMRGVEIDPGSQRSRTILAMVYMFADEVEAARKEIERALVLNPNSLFILDGIGYIMTLVGKWEKGTDLIKRVMRINPYYRNVVHYALWEDYLRRQDFESAYLETMSIQSQELFWYPLAKAASLGLLGRNKEGAKFVETLMALRPDFQQTGRKLIGHYVKFEKIREQVIRGLAGCGLEII